MHRVVRENLEEILSAQDTAAARHLAECGECREEVAAMREHSAALRQLGEAGRSAEARPGFYTRVIERVEAQRAGSLWELLFEPVFGRRIAVASLALALLLGVYLVSTEPAEEAEFALDDSAVEIFPVPVAAGQFVALHDQAGVMLPGDPDENAVLVNLVTYREQ